MCVVCIFIVPLVQLLELCQVCVTDENPPAISSLKDPAPALAKAPPPPERGLARPRCLLREPRREVAPDPRLADAKKDALAPSRPKGLGFCGVTTRPLGFFLHFYYITDDVFCFLWSWCTPASRRQFNLSAHRDGQQGLINFFNFMTVTDTPLGSAPSGHQLSSHQHKLDSCIVNMICNTLRQNVSVKYLKIIFYYYLL